MGILRRLFGGTRSPSPLDHYGFSRAVPAVQPLTSRVKLYRGVHDLEVVGESHYQDALWHIVGDRTTERVRHEISTALFPEPENPYDSNAIAVLINEAKVGYLSREDAAEYRPGLLSLQETEGCLIGLSGVIVGGGIRSDGLGFLGVWLKHNPGDFGLASIAPPPPRIMQGSLRTGLAEAWETDAEDDSYDLSWMSYLPSEHTAAISHLRQLLDQDPDPIDRHFMFCELERGLYRSRDELTSGLNEYDEVCRLHDEEMDGIRDALVSKFGKVPALETYTQMAIRQQKAKNWQEAISWARRGIALYGDIPARPEVVDDLRRRIDRYTAAIARSTTNQRAGSSRPSSKPTPAIETLTCDKCNRDFTRLMAPGRKPRKCPGCRSRGS